MQCGGGVDGLGRNKGLKHPAKTVMIEINAYN